MQVVNDEINMKIFKENEREMKELERDIESLSESFTIVSLMIAEQGENIDLIKANIEETEQNVESGLLSLEKAERYSFLENGNVKNIAIVVGTMTVGAFGFIAGPIIGIGTSISGLVAGIGIVTIT